MCVTRYTDEYDEKPVFPKQQLDWEDDIQLKSIFLDRKVVLLTFVIIIIIDSTVT